MRVEGWEQRLSAVIADHAANPFSWGSRDCATLFVRAVTAVTGGNPAANLPPWFSENSALRSLSKSGFDSVHDLVKAGFPAIHPAQARRGDLGYCDSPFDRLSCPGIVTGAEVVMMTMGGWAVIPRAALAVSYQVG